MLPDDIRREIEVSRTVEEMRVGHPTAPGFRDEYELRMGKPSPGNGQPGIPKIWPGHSGTYGVPSTHGGPFQPDTIYAGILEDDNST